VQGVDNFAPFLPLNWLPCQHPLRYRKKKDGLIICNSVSTIWCKDCENRSSGSSITSAPSEQVQYDTKLVAMATSLEILKKISDLSCTSKTFSYGVKIAKIAHGLYFAYDTKVATYLEESEKLDRIKKTHANTFW